MEIDSSGAQKGLWNPGVPPTHATSLATAIGRPGIWLYGCTQAFHRKVFEVFGPMDERVVHEDEVIPFRGLLLGTIGYIAEPLVYYRRFEKNTSGPKLKCFERPPLKKRRQTLRSDRAHLVNWLQDLRKSSVLGILPEEESEKLQAGVIERLHEKGIEWEFYTSPLPGALLLLWRRYLGWRTFRQVLRLLKRRWQSERQSSSRPT